VELAKDPNTLGSLARSTTLKSSCDNALVCRAAALEAGHCNGVVLSKVTSQAPGTQVNEVKPTMRQLCNRNPARRAQARRVTARRAAAVTELAVCLPLVILLIFASLEGANMLFVRQAAVQAAYETVKAAAKPSGTRATAEAIGRQVLTARRLTPQAVTIAPLNTESLAAGAPIQVTVQVNGASRSILGFGPFRGLVIEAQATMFKE